MYMDKKVFLGIFLVIVIVVMAWVYSGFEFQFRGEQQTLESTPDAYLSPFPLNDSLATYHLEKLGNRFTLVYKKVGELPISVYVSKDTKISPENYLNKDIIPSGEFIIETTLVQCIQAPCNPVSSTVVRLKSIFLR